MKVIFLDVDGELTYSNYKNKETANIDIEKVKMLKEICDITDAKVVISSSWREAKNHTPDIYGLLINILKNNGINVIGDTPAIETKIEENFANMQKLFTLDDLERFKPKYGTGRAAEIQKYLSEHQIENFVILDDEDWEWSDYGYEKHWIRPTWFGNGGLKREHVIKAVEILNK